jgi:hypothetical protein
MNEGLVIGYYCILSEHTKAIHLEKPKQYCCSANLKKGTFVMGLWTAAIFQALNWWGNIWWLVNSSQLTASPWCRGEGRILRSYTNGVSNCLPVLRTREPLFMPASAYDTWPARPWSVPTDSVLTYFPYYNDS